MKKDEAKWLNAERNALDNLPDYVWEWADKVNALIQYDALKREYIIDTPEEYTRHDRESLLQHIRGELEELKTVEWFNGLSDLDRALLRGRGLVG